MSQTAAVLTGLRDPKGRAIVTLPIAVRQALMEADTILRLHGMQFELLCETCYRRAQGDPNAATVVPEHQTGDGSVSELVCGCSRRRFGLAF